MVPLLYEGRLVLQLVDQKAIDKWFEVVTKPLTEAQRADLKKKFCHGGAIEQGGAEDLRSGVRHQRTLQPELAGTGFKAQLAAPRRRRR